MTTSEDLHYRINSFEDLHVRSNASERTVVGLAAPFNISSMVREGTHVYQESFKKGCFSRSLQQRASQIKVYAKHSWRKGGTSIGSARVLEETDEGLYCELKISKTREGDEALELLTDEVFDSFSVGFNEVQGGNSWSHDRRAVVRNEVKLFEISVTERPVYSEAKVMAVRSTNVFDLEDMEETPTIFPNHKATELKLRLLGLHKA